MSADLTEAIATYAKGDFKSALSKIKPLGIKEDADAQYSLCWMYQYGSLIPQNYKLSVAGIRRRLNKCVPYPVFINDVASE